MDKLFNDFRMIWTDFEWNILKFVIFVFIIYSICYHIGKFLANIFH